jgi:hypothetical protein
LSFENAPYEVEFRCRFDNTDEAYNKLPFLKDCLNRSWTWSTTIHGLSIFKSGKLLRTARILDGKDTRNFVGWKGPDKGQFANIRQEVDEEILPSTTYSRIIRNLGGQIARGNYNDIVRELERLGYPGFMSFEGTDSGGYYEPYDVKLKLMNCRNLKWPLMLEIEKTADSLEEAFQCEKDLQELGGRLGLQDRIVKEEPPTLLYNNIFSS